MLLYSLYVYMYMYMYIHLYIDSIYMYIHDNKKCVTPEKKMRNPVQLFLACWLSSAGCSTPSLWSHGVTCTCAFTHIYMYMYLCKTILM